MIQSRVQYGVSRGDTSLLHLGWCTLCQQEKGECDVCSVPNTLTTNPGAGGAKSYAQRLQVLGWKSAEVVSVNMHRLGESFVEKVSDVRRRATVDGQAAAPGESLEFLAHIRGWKSDSVGESAPGGPEEVSH